MTGNSFCWNSACSSCVSCLLLLLRIFLGALQLALLLL